MRLVKSGEQMNFFHRHGFENLPTDTQKSNALISLHNKFLKNAENMLDKGHIKDYQRAVNQYLIQARTAGIDPCAAANYHKTQIYSYSMDHYPSAPSGQGPGLIGHSDRAGYEALVWGNGIATTVDGKLQGGVFMTSMDLRPLDQVLPHSNDLLVMHDFISAAYMLGHMKWEYSQPYRMTQTTVPYIAIFAGYDEMDQMLGKTQAQVVEQRLRHRDALVEMWRKSGFDVVSGPTPLLRIADKNTGRFEHIYMPLIFNDTNTCTNFVVEEGHNGALIYTPFNTWAQRPRPNGDRLDELPIVRLHMENNEQYGMMRDYFQQFLINTKCRVSDRCVDSRSQVFDVGVSVKILAAITNETMRLSQLYNPYVQHISNTLHIDTCGGLKTTALINEYGMAMHFSFEQAYARIRNGEQIPYESGYGSRTWNLEDVQSVQRFYRSTMKRIMKGTWNGADMYIIDGFMKQMGTQLNAEQLKTMESLFSSSLSDTRHTVEYVSAADLLVWNDALETCVMPDAMDLQNRDPDSPLLPHKRSGDETQAKAQDKAYLNKLTLQVAKRQWENWQTTIENNHDDIVRTRLHLGKKLGLGDEGLAQPPQVKVQIEKVSTPRAVIYTEDGEHAFDSITGRPVEI